MNEQLQFEFRGSEGREAAGELSEFLRHEFADWQSNVAEQSPADAVLRSDPVAVIALILSVPSAILATWDLAERMKLRAKVDHLITWAKVRAACGKANPTLMLPQGRAVPLDEAKPEQILDAVDAAAKARW